MTVSGVVLKYCNNNVFCLQLDYVIETNFSTIKSLEAVLKKMNRMPADEAAKFKLDNTLGGTSDFINRNSIHR